MDYIAKYSNRTFLGLSLLTAPFLMSKNGLGWNSKSKEKIKDKQTEYVTEQTKTYNINAFERTHTQNLSGDIDFNEWSLIAPVQIDGKIETKTIDSTITTIPYHWAETFKEIDAIAPNQRDSLEKQLVSELKQEFSQALAFYGIGSTTQEVDAYKKGNMRQEGTKTNIADVKSITITGMASPEGRMPESVKEGNIDPENMELAQKRAQDMEPYIKQALTQLGVDAEKIESIKAEEVQFSQEEYGTIVDLAIKNGYTGKVDTTTAVFNFIKDYNHGIIKDASTSDQMKSILEGKRGVKVEVVSEGKNSKEIIVPLPLLLLLLPSMFQGLKGINWENFWKRKKVNEIDPPTLPLIKEPRQIFSESTFNQIALDKEDKNFHDLYRSAVETENANYQDISRISDLVYTQEIYPYLNHTESIEKGLDYKLLVENAQYLRGLKPPHYKRESEIKEKLTEYVLEDWQEYDRNVREGIKTTTGVQLPVKTTVEYRHDPKKVIWAIQAAEHIFELSNAKSDEELEDLMDKKRAEIEERRKIEIAGIPAKQEDRIVSDPVVTPTKESTIFNHVVSVEPATTVPEQKKDVLRDKPEEGKEVFIPESNDGSMNFYKQYKEDNKQLGYMMDGFAQALSPENLRKIYASHETEKNIITPKQKIDAIDAELRIVEVQLNDKNLRKDEKVSIEEKFNELEQEKRKIQEEFRKTLEE